MYVCIYVIARALSRYVKVKVSESNHITTNQFMLQGISGEYLVQTPWSSMET